MVAKTAPLPNLRRMFVPDKGYLLVDADLKGADAQVVAWDSGDEPLKQLFREGKPLHAENAKVMFGELAGPDGRKQPYYKECKQGVHATNYGGSPNALVAAMGWPLARARWFQETWFDHHPAIKDWHIRIDYQLQSTRSVCNKFGYRIVYFDRVEGLLPEGLAWIPQSTVAINCNRGLLQVRNKYPWVQMLLQVHDSGIFQIPYHREDKLPEIEETLKVEIPYEDPLVIPWGIKTSRKSWGEAA